MVDRAYAASIEWPAEVSLLRIYLLRATYFVVAVGLGSEIWPLIFHHRPWADHTHSVGVAMLAGVSGLALLGLRYPLQMLPLIFFDFVWKAIWLAYTAAPLWLANAVDASTADNIFACSLGAIFPIVIPWRYVLAHYVKQPGDRWR